jgi:serine/threonine-protein kinase RsbW
MSVDYAEFEAELHLLESMIDWIRERTLTTGFSPQGSRKIELALEEALVNVILHAYKENKGKIELCSAPSSPPGIIFVVKDRGPPFNPLLQIPEVEFPESESIDEKREGGLGLLLISRYMDEVRYQWIQPHNVLTLIKYLE